MWASSSLVRETKLSAFLCEPNESPKQIFHYGAEMKAPRSKTVQTVIVAMAAATSFATVWILTGLKERDDSGDPYKDKNIRKN
jgi:hypothetical protein